MSASKGLPLFLTWFNACARSEGRFHGLGEKHLTGWDTFAQIRSNLCPVARQYRASFRTVAALRSRPIDIAIDDAWLELAPALIFVLVPWEGKKITRRTPIHRIADVTGARSCMYRFHGRRGDQGVHRSTSSSQ